MTIDVLTFRNDHTPLDLLLYRHYAAEIAGLVEATLAQNPGLAAMGVFPPKGTVVNVTTPAPAATRQTTRTVIKLYE